MPGNSFGKRFRITTWGESHGPAVGVVIDGCPANLQIAESDIQQELDKRRPGASPIATSRQEADRVVILSGVFNQLTTGTPIALMIANTDTKTSDYEYLAEAFRPGHADYTYHRKFGFRDWRGGGRSSARETAARVAAGAVAKKVLERYGVHLLGFVEQIGSIRCSAYDLAEIDRNPVRCPDREAAQAMLELVATLANLGDSIGSIVKLVISNVPGGLGEPVFDKLPAVLAHALFSIPAVKGVEFGAGFEAATMQGSQCNDAMIPGESEPRFLSNHAGGALGGISTGQDITARIAFKPPASIRIPQQTVTTSGQPLELTVTGRHDPVIGPRAVAVVEAMAALVMADFILRSQADRGPKLRKTEDLP